MKKVLPLIAIVACCLGAKAQNYCEKTSIYFELNKSELTHAGSKKIDSLLHTLAGKSYLVELYGYTDSLATAEYNLQLSKKRIAAVQAKLNAKSSIHFVYQEKNLGESKSSGDAAQDRRVDIFPFPESNNRITIASEKESAVVAIDYFDPCGICNSKPQVKGIYTKEEATKLKMVALTSTKEELITAGMIQFTSKPCQGRTSKNDTVVLSLKTDYVDTEMSLWEPDTIDKVIHWKPSSIKLIYDTANSQYTVRSTKRLLNVGKKINSRIVFPTDFVSMRSNLTTSQKVRTSETTNDTMLLGKPDTTVSVLSLGKTSNGTIYLFNEKMVTVSNIGDNSKKYFTLKRTYTIPFSSYKEFAYTDSTIRIKFKKNVKPDQFGYFLKEYNEFITISPDMKGKFVMAPKPVGKAYQLAFMKKKKLYAVDQKKIKMKYSKRKKAYKLKFKKGNIIKFKQNKSYTPPPEEKKK